MVIKALNRAGAGVGDLVLVSLSSPTVLKSAALFYMIPLVGLLSGAVTGAALNRRLPLGETGGAILFGFAGLFLGFVMTRLVTKFMSANNRLTPVITEIIRKGVIAPESLMVIDPH
jgi:sigma-E factor negative regulatory protein RseC